MSTKRFHDAGKNPKSHSHAKVLQHPQCVCGHYSVLHDFDNELTRGECLNPYCGCAKFVRDVRANPTTNAKSTSSR